MKQKTKKQKTQYTCCFCDFKTYNRTNYNTHLRTKRHKNKAIKVALNDNKMITNEVNKVLNDNIHTLNDNQFICECGKRYKYNSGLSRHKTKCTFIETIEEDEISTKKNISVDDLGKGNILSDIKNCESPKEALSIVLEAFTKQQQLISQLIQQQSDIIPKIGNNNNNKININVFLNEHCKDAMNLTDFIEKIKVSIEDLEYTDKNGYVKGISNIFTKQLTDMKITERPIHCSDTKKLQFYVKDSDKWQKDKLHKRLNQIIRKISTKQKLQLQVWMDNHPNYLDDENLYLKYQKFIFSFLEDNDETKEANENNKIKKNIGEIIKLDNIITSQ